MINRQLITSRYHLSCKKLFLICLLLLGATLVQAQLTVHFNYCSATLLPAEKEKIKNFIDCNGNTQPQISIGGHTGNTKGRERANQLLSEKRAAAVTSFIHTLPCRIVVDSSMGYGGTRPLAIANKAANRRAEIWLVERVALTSTYDEDSAMGKARFSALYQQLTTPPQSFCISPEKDTMLVGEKGTIIRIKKGDLAISECSCVTILLNEYFDKSEMILNNLTTTSDGKQLESGGMIKIEAACNGKLVPMATGRSIGIWVPTDTVLPGMKLFTANRDSASQLLNWAGKNQVLDEIDYNRMLWWCGGTGRAPEGKCPFFFCGLTNFIKHPFGVKKWKLKQLMKSLEPEQQLAVKYQLDTNTVRKALEKSKAYNPKLIKYYAFQNTDWGYRNCDRYMNAIEFTNLYVKESPKDNIHTKFAEKNTKSIIPGTPRKEDYQVSQVATKQPGWAIAIKLTGHTIFLSMKPANSSDGSTKPEYREVTLAELRQNIRLMDTN